MNTKKVLLICVALMMVLFSITAVSAGLFDFGSGISGEIKASIKDSSVEITDMGDSAFMTTSLDKPGELIYIVNLTFNGTLKIELENATDDQISYIKDNIDSLNITTKFNADKFDDVCLQQDGGDVSYSIDGTTLTIKFDSAIFESSATEEFILGDDFGFDFVDVTVTIPAEDGNITVVAK